MADTQEQFVRINTDKTELANWAHRTGLPLRSVLELETIYLRCHPFIIKNKNMLVKEHGWEELFHEPSELFFVVGHEPVSPSQFSLTTTFYTLWDNNDHSYFDGFIAQRLDPPQNCGCDLIVAGPPPLCNIFYMLQCIAPGRLLLVNPYELNGEREEHLRALPLDTWVSHHRDCLIPILGSNNAYADLLDASRSYGCFHRTVREEEEDCDAILERPLA